MRAFATVATVACLVDFVFAAGWFPTRGFQPNHVKRTTPATNGFVTQQGTQLLLNGK
jgi:hypothetical protein